MAGLLDLVKNMGGGTETPQGDQENLLARFFGYDGNGNSKPILPDWVSKLVPEKPAVTGIRDGTDNYYLRLNGGTGTGDQAAGNAREENWMTGTRSNPSLDPNLLDSDPLDVMRVRRGAKSNTFGNVRVNENGTPRPHQGVDLYAPTDTPVKAVGNGVIHSVGEDKDYGNWVILQFDKEGKPHYALYAHLNEIGVAKGATVKAGQDIGKSGTTGNAADMEGEDQHLHFELAPSGTFGTGLGDRFDPMKFFRTKMEVNNDE